MAVNLAPAGLAASLAPAGLGERAGVAFFFSGAALAEAVVLVVGTEPVGMPGTLAGAGTELEPTLLGCPAGAVAVTLRV